MSLHEAYHILIIEDDPAVAQSLRTGLIEEGFRVSWRKEGRAGIALAQEQQTPSYHPRHPST